MRRLHLDSMNPFKITQYQLYLLQLENYELGRYWRLLFKKGIWGAKQPQRKFLVWTQKVKALLLAAIVLQVAAAIIISRPVGHGIGAAVVFILALLIFSYFNFIFFTLALWLVWPVDKILKAVIVARAKKRIIALQSIDSRHFLRQTIT